jgi:hypothetical protein
VAKLHAAVCNGPWTTYCSLQHLEAYDGLSFSGRLRVLPPHTARIRSTSETRSISFSSLPLQFSVSSSHSYRLSRISTSHDAAKLFNNEIYKGLHWWAERQEQALNFIYFGLLFAYFGCSSVIVGVIIARIPIMMLLLSPLAFSAVALATNPRVLRSLNELPDKVLEARLDVKVPPVSNPSVDLPCVYNTGTVSPLFASDSQVRRTLSMPHLSC